MNLFEKSRATTSKVHNQGGKRPCPNFLSPLIEGEEGGSCKGDYINFFLAIVFIRLWCGALITNADPAAITDKIPQTMNAHR